MKALYLAALASGLSFICKPAVAQQNIDIVNVNKIMNDTTWKSKTEFGANLNQGSFNSAWTGGGVNSVAIGVYFNALRELKVGKHTWRNDLQAQYGIVRNQGMSSRKNIDRLFFDSKYGYQISKNWSVVGNVNFLTQFAPGYQYGEDVDGNETKSIISGFLAPGYLTEAIGIQYSPVPYFYATFSPGAMRQTFVKRKDLGEEMQDWKNYGVAPGKVFRNEVSLFQIVANYDNAIAKNMNLKWRYQMFAAMNKARNTPFHTDHRLDAILTAKVNKWVNVNVGAIMIYDDDQVNRVQWAQSLSLGFLYTF